MSCVVLLLIKLILKKILLKNPRHVGIHVGSNIHCIIIIIILLDLVLMNYFFMTCIVSYYKPTFSLILVVTIQDKKINISFVHAIKREINMSS